MMGGEVSVVFRRLLLLLLRSSSGIDRFGGGEIEHRLMMMLLLRTGEVRIAERMFVFTRASGFKCTVTVLMVDVTFGGTIDRNGFRDGGNDHGWFDDAMRRFGREYGWSLIGRNRFQMKRLFNFRFFVQDGRIVGRRDEAKAWP